MGKKISLGILVFVFFSGDLLFAQTQTDTKTEYGSTVTISGPVQALIDETYSISINAASTGGAFVYGYYFYENTALIEGSGFRWGNSFSREFQFTHNTPGQYVYKFGYRGIGGAHGWPPYTEVQITVEVKQLSPEDLLYKAYYSARGRMDTLTNTSSHYINVILADTDEAMRTAFFDGADKKTVKDIEKDGQKQLNDAADEHKQSLTDIISVFVSQAIEIIDTAPTPEQPYLQGLADQMLDWLSKAKADSQTDVIKQTNASGILLNVLGGQLAKIAKQDMIGEKEKWDAKWPIISEFLTTYDLSKHAFTYQKQGIDVTEYTVRLVGFDTLTPISADPNGDPLLDSQGNPITISGEQVINYKLQTELVDKLKVVDPLNEERITGNLLVGPATTPTPGGGTTNMTMNVIVHIGYTGVDGYDGHSEKNSGDNGTTGKPGQDITENNSDLIEMVVIAIGGNGGRGGAGYYEEKNKNNVIAGAGGTGGKSGEAKVTVGRESLGIAIGGKGGDSGTTYKLTSPPDKGTDGGSAEAETEKTDTIYKNYNSQVIAIGGQGGKGAGWGRKNVALASSNHGGKGGNGGESTAKANAVGSAIAVGGNGGEGGKGSDRDAVIGKDAQAGKGGQGGEAGKAFAYNEIPAIAPAQPGQPIIKPQARAMGGNGGLGGRGGDSQDIAVQSGNDGVGGKGGSSSANGPEPHTLTEEEQPRLFPLFPTEPATDEYRRATANTGGIGGMPGTIPAGAVSGTAGTAGTPGSVSTINTVFPPKGK